MLFLQVTELQYFIRHSKAHYHALRDTILLTISPPLLPLPNCNQLGDTNLVDDPMGTVGISPSFGLGSTGKAILFTLNTS
ncbi:hypothetical protein [Flexithrix dorotheae]|uniref:hypothetical protein n=1 Tax=Flexithrix dorotheae TaxID=70993 RepID=UPI00037C2D14|nr:hypothetical protein [Flexithrix dorotheae]